MSILQMNKYKTYAPSMVRIGVSLLFITLNLGYYDIAVRDLGLAIATFSVFLYGYDKLSLDKRVKESKLVQNSFLKILYIFED